MKRIVLFLICLFAVSGYSAGERHGFRFWELLSLSFDEFSVDNSGTIRGRLNGFTEYGFYMKTGTCVSYISSRDRPFEVKHGEVLTFGRSRSLASSICALDLNDPKIKTLDLPAQMREERYYLQIKTRDVEVLVGTSSQKAFIPEENALIDFPLPFKTVWTDQRDYDLWSSSGGRQRRFKKVEKISEGEKLFAAGLFRCFPATNLQFIVGSSCVGGTTNAQVAVTDELTKVVPGVVAPFVVQITGINSQLRVSGFSFVAQDDKCRRSRRYRFDADGHFIYGWRIDRVNENGAPGRVALDMSFAFDAEGKLRRAWTPGSNPLMIDKGNKLYFTGDPELAIEYRKEVDRALDGLPRLK